MTGLNIHDLVLTHLSISQYVQNMKKIHILHEIFIMMSDSDSHTLQLDSFFYLTYCCTRVNQNNCAVYHKYFLKVITYRLRYATSHFIDIRIKVSFHLMKNQHVLSPWRTETWKTRRTANRNIQSLYHLEPFVL